MVINRIHALAATYALIRIEAGWETALWSRIEVTHLALFRLIKSSNWNSAEYARSAQQPAWKPSPSSGFPFLFLDSGGSELIACSNSHRK
jgi:hypothetical protein